MTQRTRVLAAVTALASAGAAAAMVVTAPVALASSPNPFPAHVFAPYVDTWTNNVTLTDVANKYGTKFFTIAFVDGANCQWSLPGQSTVQSQLDNLRAQGGDVSMSFGGYGSDSNLTELGDACSSPSAVATQIESVITTFNLGQVDFDVEANSLTNSAGIDRRNKALAMVRSWAAGNGRQLGISVTIPTSPGGLTQDGVTLLNNAQANGFVPDVVNIMTMDYGTAGTEMGDAANQALDAVAGQVASAFSLSTSAAYAKLGSTPMLGQNDTGGEIFTLADASSVESHAAAKGIARLSDWSQNRDNGGCAGQTSASGSCSGISQNTGDFAVTFQKFASGSTTPPSTTTTTTSAPTGSLANGGFESGALGPWTCQAGGGVVSTPVHAGSHALHVAATSSQTGECDQTVALSPNTAYILTGWVQGSYANLGVSGGASASTWTSSGAWSQLSVSFTTGSSGTVTVFTHGWYGQGDVYADDISVS